jgi:hypothetical protein
MAQSMARLVNFWNDHPAWAGRGMRISVSSSPGSSAVSNRPSKNSPAGISRRPARQLAADQAGVRHVVMGGEGPDRDVAVLLADVGELAEPADVDQHLGHGQPELHEREQRMAAGQEFRVIAALGGQAQGLVHRPGPLVGEGCGNH